ncbi:MAG: NADH-quinone oxidoreductase subunit A [Dehalococcoidia bacterium]|nr:NADH-quinone oxidoreductase subunit A [Dehalococcoidia bacterium]|tara:strand:+ start:1923 stop:2291 length:369 start_codon:yes stop_codon:yes gene_type:complete
MPEVIVENWTSLLVAGLVGLVAILIMFFLSFLLSARSRSREKEMPYECGIPPAPYSFSQINIRYYLFAILFLIFDVEAVFLFPWALVFVGNNLAFYAMLIFLGVLGIAILYCWRRGVLEWQK